MTSSQMLKGVLEGCVLALIGRGETYGYELVGTLAASGFADIAEGTLYPLLMRLEKKGFIASTYRESEVGPRRKYYRITDAGASEVNAFAEEFAHLSEVVERVLGGRSESGDATAEAGAATPVGSAGRADTASSQDPARPAGRAAPMHPMEHSHGADHATEQMGESHA